jgi:hypothetical protein
VKDLDFLPEWYKEGKRRYSAVRKQYVALVAVFLVMMAFNLTATHRAARVAAEVARHESGRARAEAVVHEFSAVVKELNQMGAKAKLVRQVDLRIDVAGVLAEISHIVDESVVLSKVELVAEPFSQPEDKSRTTNAPVRAAAKTGEGERALPLGDSRLRVVLAGVAAHPANVADLVCRLEESSFFQQVRPSFYSKTKIQVGASRGAPRQADAAGTNAAESLDVTAFEITCYLANYEPIEGS